MSVTELVLNGMGWLKLDAQKNILFMSVTDLVSKGTGWLKLVA